MWRLHARARAEHAVHCVLCCLQVRWVDPGPEREEQLVSISTDGKVKAWTVAKGLEHNTLITLKRVPHRLVASAGGGRASHGAPLSAGAAAAAAVAATGTVPAGSGAKAAATVAALRGDGSGSRGAVISRNTGDMSFDFSSLDRRMYLAGGHVVAACAQLAQIGRPQRAPLSEMCSHHA